MCKETTAKRLTFCDNNSTLRVVNNNNRLEIAIAIATIAQWRVWYWVLWYRVLRNLRIKAWFEPKDKSLVHLVHGIPWTWRDESLDSRRKSWWMIQDQCLDGWFRTKWRSWWMIQDDESLDGRFKTMKVLMEELKRRWKSQRVRESMTGLLEATISWKHDRSSWSMTVFYFTSKTEEGEHGKPWMEWPALLLPNKRYFKTVSRYFRWQLNISTVQFQQFNRSIECFKRQWSSIECFKRQ